MNPSKFVNFSIVQTGVDPRFCILEKFPNMETLELPEFGIKIYPLCNIFPSATFGANCQIGAYTEIGNNVSIGSNVRIGAKCFIPEGVIIEDNAWIGPGCFFSNDMYPPSTKEDWMATVIMKGARLGAAVRVRPGVIINKNALIGMGAVVVHDIPEGETWAGVPAKQIQAQVRTD